MKLVIIFMVIAISITFERRAGKEYTKNMEWLDSSDIGGADRKILENVFLQSRVIHSYFATVSTTVIAIFLYLVWA